MDRGINKKSEAIMDRKILYIATSDIHLATFHMPYLKWLKGCGYHVDIVAENRYNISFPFIDNFISLPFPRSLFRKVLFSTYKRLKKVIDQNQYSLIHCHTPIPSFITRIAARRSRKFGTKVLYTAHGFHFYKGAPLKYWLFYYVAEYILSIYTDGIITMNKEDFSYVNGKMFHADSYYIKGIGINTEKLKSYNKNDNKQLRSELGYSNNEFILLYVAEFIPRKNHRFIIQCTPELLSEIPNIRILFAGKGTLLEEMKASCFELGIEKNIDFLGFRNDVDRFIAITDIGISASRQEGLPIGLAEKMYCFVPVVATIERGHKELINNGVNGFLFEQGDQKGFIECILTLYKNSILRKQMGEKAHETALEFTTENSLKSMAKIYNKYLA